MKKHAAVVASSLVLALLAGTVHAAVADSSITAAAKEYDRLFEQSREAGERPGIADMGDFVDKAFADVPIDQLTLGQINLAITSAPVRFSTKTAAAIMASLNKTAASPTADGARAEILKLNMFPNNVKPPEVLAAIQAALNHPGIKQAVSEGAGGPIFEYLTDLTGPDLLAVRSSLLALKDSVSAKGSVPFFMDAASFAMAAPHALSPEDLATFMPLRAKIASVLAEKLQGNVSDHDRPYLERAQGQLNGAYARGELLGHKAPPIDFTWFKDPTNPDHVIKSLDDLKGKVVVLDFWATWCGPCIASFPHVKALARYYKGYDVVVLGVTSLQGFVNTAGGRVDTTGDPAKEYALTADFLKAKDVTWDVGISKQSVFNPDYGVTGIPDAVVIDGNGIVKYVDLYPGSPLTEETPKVDAALSQSGLVIPASLVEMKRPTPTKTQ